MREGARASCCRPWRERGTSLIALVKKWLPPALRSATPEERTFCREWIARQSDEALKAAYVHAFLMNSSVFLAPLPVIDPTLIKYTATLHLPTIAILLVGRLGQRSKRLWYGAMYVAYYYAIVAALGILYHVIFDLNRPELLAPAYTAVAAVICISPIFYPGSATQSLVPLALVWTGLTIIKGSWHDNWMLHVILLVFFALAFGVRLAFDALRVFVARMEYRFRMLTTPQHIMLRSIREGVTIEALFQPEVRRCVCISCGWRQFHTVAKGVAATTLATALDAYYAVTFDLLNRLVPAGNFFADWLSDELFIVIYAEAGQDGVGIADVALQLARELLAADNAQMAGAKLAPRIDIGLAAGQALLGMMGPDDHRKATAIGETPGRSRRMQSLGKRLRKARGEGNWVIFGDDVRQGLTDVGKVRELPLDRREVRDIEDQVVYYVAASDDGAPSGEQEAA